MPHIPVIEALLFTSPVPLTLDDMQKVLPDTTQESLEETIVLLNQRYQESGSSFMITALGEGWQFLTKEEYAPYIEALYTEKKKSRLSKKALETLAIIMYKQPLTRAEIDAIRTVQSDHIVRLLLERDFIKMAGRKEVPGRPILYETTETFLKYFGLKSLKDLPKLEDIVTHDQKEQ